jgi:hypothetical protein
LRYQEPLDSTRTTSFQTVSGRVILRSSHGALAGGIMPVGKGNDTRRLRVMRAFVMVEPKFFTPEEIFPALLEGFVAWREANREHMETFEFFAGGGGGFGIFNGDEATLNRIMVQYPFFPYSQITVRPILDGDTALGQLREIMSEAMGEGPPV